GVLATYLHDRHPQAESNALRLLQERVRRERRPLTPEDIAAVAQEYELPIAWVHGVASFYEDLDLRPRGTHAILCCQGTACLVDGSRAAQHALESALGIHEGEVTPDGQFSIETVYCLGRCHTAPSAMVVSDGDERMVIDHLQHHDPGALITSLRNGTLQPDAQDVIVEAHCDPTVLLRRIDRGAFAIDLATALAGGAYAGLVNALTMTPQAVIDEVKASGLRGRGGAGFPTGNKWQFAAANAADQKYICCNADEGDPGSYIDKLLLERDPHAVLAGIAIAGYAIGATRGVIYLRSEYPEAIAVLERAIREATEAGWLGSRIQGSEHDFRIELFIGSGAYVCGEETAMLRSIEGLRGEVSVRPPFPAQKGLYGKPTVVNNVETLATIGWIIEHGGTAYNAVGVGRSRGTKAVSLNSLFVRPGLYEVPLGVTLNYICNDLGGGLREGLTCKGIQIGGPMGGIIPPSQWDTPLGFEELAAIGGLLGHGGIVAFSQHDHMRDIAEHLLQFTADESCGKCVPCRIGSVRGVELVQRLVANPASASTEIPRLEELLETMELGSLCALGGGVPAALWSILKHYRHELTAAEA
ncbi:MAG: NAD(P)H-dependent oxidoreductase subunit E, partial [bacterium]